MRSEEHDHIVWGDLGFFNEDSSGADWEATFPNDRSYTVGMGVEFSLPVFKATLTRLVLARYAAGTYTTAQVAEWLQTQDDEIAYGLFSQIREEQQFEEEYSDVRDVPEELLRPWLLQMHNRPDFYEDEDGEAESDEIIPLFYKLLPQAYEMEEGDAGGGLTSGGSGGDLLVPAGQSLGQVLEQVSANLERYLEELEPSITPAAVDRRP